MTPSGRGLSRVLLAPGRDLSPSKQSAPFFSSCHFQTKSVSYQQQKIMSTQTTAVATREISTMEFVPFGAKDKIKLSCEIVRKYIAVPTKEGDLPDDRDCTRFMMLCRSRQLNPFEGDAYLLGYRNREKNIVEWSLITAHQAFLKRAEPHAEFNGKQSGVIFSPAIECKTCQGEGGQTDKPCPRCHGRGEIDEIEGDFLPESIRGETVKLIGGWCKVFFKTRANPEYQRLKLSTYNKGFGNWTKDPAGMICKCAEAAALRSAFPTSLGGMYLQEEQHSVLPEVTAMRPIFGQLSPAEPPKALPDGPKPAATAPAAAPKPAEVPTTPPEPKPVSAAPEPKKDAPATSMNYVKAVRMLCKGGKIQESVLIDFLQTTGSVSGDCQSIEEVHLNNPEVLALVADQWSDIQEKLQRGS